MPASYTFDIFSSLDGFGSASDEWGGYWGKQGPELLERRLGIYSEPCHMVYGAKTFQLFSMFMANVEEYPDVEDEWGLAMRRQPTTVLSKSLNEPLDWPTARLDRRDAVEAIGELKELSEAPIRSHGSLALNHNLMAAGLVDFIHVTIFPVVTGETGDSPVFADLGDYDLDLVDSRLLDGRTQELIYRPRRHIAHVQ